MHAHFFLFICAVFYDSIAFVEAAVSPFPDDVEALKALLATATQRADDAEARLANACARESATEAVIAHLKLQIAKLGVLVTAVQKVPLSNPLKLLI